MDNISDLLALPELALDPKQREQISNLLRDRFVPAESARALKLSSDELAKKLESCEQKIAKLNADNNRLANKLSTIEADYAVEKLFAEYDFASERIKQSVIAEFKAKNFKCENGSFVGGREFLEKLKINEPEIFAAPKPPFFMAGTRGNVGMEANNSAAQFASSFGLKGFLGSKF